MSWVDDDYNDKVRRVAAEVLISLGVFDLDSFDLPRRREVAAATCMWVAAGEESVPPHETDDFVARGVLQGKIELVFGELPRRLPQRVGRDVGAILGLVDPVVPDWVGPGAYVFCSRRAPSNVRIDRVDGPFVYLAGESDDPIPIGLFLSRYQRSDPSKNANGIPCSTCGVAMSHTGCVACAEATHRANVTKLVEQLTSMSRP